VDHSIDILLAALLVVPTCLGLWHTEDHPPAQDGGVMKRLLERRRVQRRNVNGGGTRARVNYFFLESSHPDHATLPENPESRWDRRVRGRRAEDANPGTPIIDSSASAQPIVPTFFEVDVPAVLLDQRISVLGQRTSSGPGSDRDTGPA